MIVEVATPQESLNWSITVMIGYFAGLILTVILIGVLVMGLVGTVHVIFCLMGAITCASGQPFRAPFALRLLK